jgi:hypothetical protein
MIEQAGEYTAEQIAAEGLAEGLKAFTLLENPEARYVGGSWLGAQKWAVAQGGTATLVNAPEED